MGTTSSTYGTEYKDTTDVEPGQLSPGCNKALLYDDDWSADNKWIYSDVSYLEYDLRNALAGYKLYANSGEELVEEKSAAHLNRTDESFGHGREVDKVTKNDNLKPSDWKNRPKAQESGCWWCSPNGPN